MSVLRFRVPAPADEPENGVPSAAENGTASPSAQPSLETIAVPVERRHTSAPAPAAARPAPDLALPFDLGADAPALAHAVVEEPSLGPRDLTPRSPLDGLAAGDLLASPPALDPSGLATLTFRDLDAAVAAEAAAAGVAPPAEPPADPILGAVPLRRRAPRPAPSAPLPFQPPLRPLRLAPNAIEGGAAFYRRRGEAPVRRRRRTSFVLLRRFFTALVLVALPVAAALWLLGVPRLRLAEFAVDGIERVEREWMVAALRPFRGQNLMLVSLAEVHAALERNPWVASVELRKEMPDRLVVRVKERVPLAVLEQHGRRFYADRQGHLIAPFDEARGPHDLLVVRAPKGGKPDPATTVQALELATEIGHVNPTWSGQLVALEALGDGGFRVETQALPFPLLLRAGAVGERGRVLVQLLPEIERRYPSVAQIDLRFQRRIVITPGHAPSQASAGEIPAAAAPPSTGDEDLSRRG